MTFALGLIALAVLLSDPAATEVEDDTAFVAQVDVADIIACKYDVQTYNRYAMTGASTDGGTFPGLTKVEGENPFLSEYESDRPVNVFGYTTRRVVFTSAGMMAVLDTPDAAKVAAELGVPSAMDMPGKFLGEKTVSEIKETADGEDWIYSVKLNVSTVTSHPGKTLAGCSYTVGGTLFD
jgi:hypothetical protein